MKNSLANKLLKEAVIKNWYYVFILFLLSIIVACVSSISPLFYKKIIDEAIPEKNIYNLIVYICILVFLPILNMVLSNVREKAGFLFSDNCSKVMRRACFERALFMNYPNFEEIGAQKMMHTITRSIGRITELYLYSDFVNFVTNTVQLIVVFIIIQHFSVKIALLSFVLIPILYIIVHVFSGKAGNVEKMYIEHLDKCEKFLLQCFYGMKTVRSYNGQHTENVNFDEWLNENSSIGWKLQRTHNLIRVLIPHSVGQIVLGFLFVICSIFVINDSMSIGTLVAIVAYIPTLISSINGILSIKVGKSSISKILPDIEAILLSEIEENENQTEQITNYKNAFCFNNVTFSYGRGDFNLKIKELSINRGEFVAVVGTSGGGKTSILDILNGFYPVKDGDVMFFNEYLSRINPNFLRKQISSVFQDVYVFNKSIAENISYPDPPDKKKITNVIEKTMLKEFVNSLPEKENTIINDFGSNFSGGECQRISLARAFYKDSDVFLLDEPTAALDAITSEIIFNYLISQNKENGKTIIMITHDIGKALLADKVVVIDNGIVEAVGNPNELIKQNGKFKSLCDAYQNQ